MIGEPEPLGSFTTPLPCSMILAKGLSSTRLVSMMSASLLIGAMFLSMGVLAAPATHPSSARCGTAVVTNLVLSSDLVCAGSGITLAADGITIALNGHSITGPSRGPPLVGIRVVGRAGVSIEGPGTVTNFRTGIVIAGSHDVTVTRVSVMGNGLSGFLDGDGIRVLSSTGVTIEKCDVRNNGNDGIQIVASTGVVLKKNDVSGSLGGINLAAVGNQIEKNTITANACGVKGSTAGNELKKNQFAANVADF